MSRTLDCMVCGHRGTDVEVGLTYDPRPPKVTIRIPVSHRQNAVEVEREFDGFYDSLQRCRDAVACARRVRERAEAEKAAAPEPMEPADPAEADEEVPTWL